MLETKELVKIYKPKKGIPVTALNKVSLKFPDKGMVFLLGKSGSGKSTLLNVLGGLDNYNDGAIIIKGVSSKDFKQKHFDSYRNTYVGFIFQEYNILDDFTVGANIALAIELQGRKATDEEINGILKEVDLEGYGNRKPNELSGGQKQRVAIARALVKKPEIIMADEPTGALDSNTGKAIFDTLKKLSREKLVIVVSHDRDFAENYADRIIELADGVVVSDVEYDESYSVNNDKQELVFNGDIIEIPEEYSLTEADRLKINEYIKELKSSAKLKLSIGNSLKKFIPTDSSKIKSEDGSNFKLIKSKLPLKNAFKIGGSGLKHKKFRLVMTILLSCIAFALFGLSDTFGAYNHIETCTNSLYDTGLKYVASAKAKKIGEGVDSYWREFGYHLSEKELSDFKEKTGVEMHGVYCPQNCDLSVSHHIDDSVEMSETEYNIFNAYFNGFAEINAETVDKMHFEILTGVLPDGSKNEIAISEYIFEIFKRAKYNNGEVNKEGKPVFTEIRQYSDMLGKILKIDGVNYTVTAVIDTNLDIERYISLTEKKENQTKAEALVDMVLLSEFDSAVNYSYATLIMTGDGFIQNLLSKRAKIADITEGYIHFYNDYCSVDSNNLARLGDISDKKIVWLDGAKTSLQDNEIIATSDCVYEHTELNYETAEEKLKLLFGKSREFTSGQNIFAEGNEYENVEGYKIVGYIINDEANEFSSTVVCSDNLFNKFCEGLDYYYNFCVGAMPQEKNDIKTLVSYCYSEENTIRYPVQSSVTFELDSINEALKILSKVFLWIGIGFAVFAALMLANFIAISISHKKQEIGILRAIGSRSNDVFRIFFAESFIIAIINFVLSSIGVGVATAVINYVFRNEIGILVTVLSFTVRQVLLILAVSILVAFLASYIPVKKIASKRPIDAIRDR